MNRIVNSLAGGHQRICPYTPRHNCKVERYNRLLADEALYARPYPDERVRRDAIVGMWVNHCKYHQPHTVCVDPPPALRNPVRVNNVTPSYT